MISWGAPWALALLVLLPVPFFAVRRRSAATWSSLELFPKPRWGGWGLARLAGLPTLLQTAAIACVAVGIAAPRTVGGRTYIAARGVAIVVALDHSSSMNARDFPSAKGPIRRLDAARDTFLDFLAARRDDLIGLVAFANYPDPACLPTLDHRAAAEAARAIKVARPEEDGTNLGDAIAWSLAILRETSPKKKVLILLTDGRNSPAAPSAMDPEDAAILASELEITLHTIAIGPAATVHDSPNGEKAGPIGSSNEGPDLELLQAIAARGGGRAFVATNAGELERVFALINTLERSELTGKVETRYHEHYAPWLVAGACLVALERFLALGRLRRLP